MEFKRKTFITTVTLTTCLLAGCDFTVNATGEGAISSSSNGDIFRGLAFRMEQVGEDPSKTNRRRDVFEALASKTGVEVGDGFIETLESNPHFSNVHIQAQTYPAGSTTVNMTTVQFTVDDGPTVELSFMIPEMRALGIFRLSKLPTLDSVSFHQDGNPINLRADSRDILIASVNKDKSLLSDFLKNRIPKTE